MGRCEENESYRITSIVLGSITIFISSILIGVSILVCITKSRLSQKTNGAQGTGQINNQIAQMNSQEMEWL
uniref:Uncharacterized protein n=1 Tax=Strongyloides stercoralis TaxID=6248 RepID=A0A0K0DSF8_STRER